ncbi:MAG TPA: 50S ribosomal protein L5 [Patescibacteria group bacterium]|nr:50S ribosomal protein L5 [Patescibacteria group bacterium]
MKSKDNSPRLKKLYNETIIPAMMADFGIKNRMAVPAIKKISVNVGVGKIVVADSKAIEQVVNNISKITGQRPVVTKAKKAIAGFKLREAMPVGVSVTLRGPRMYEFLDRLVNIALPRIRDFRGLKTTSFDQQGNYSIGIKEYMVFPEIVQESNEITHGLQVNISLSKKNKEMGTALLKKFGFPFKEDKK